MADRDAFQARKGKPKAAANAELPPSCVHSQEQGTGKPCFECWRWLFQPLWRACPDLCLAQPWPIPTARDHALDERQRYASCQLRGIGGFLRSGKAIWRSGVTTPRQMLLGALRTRAKARQARKRSTVVCNRSLFLAFAAVGTVVKTHIVDRLRDRLPERRLPEETVQRGSRQQDPLMLKTPTHTSATNW